jgi:hypothetical protein
VAQVLVSLQRLDRRAGRRRLAVSDNLGFDDELPAFSDADFDADPAATDPPLEPDPAAAPPRSLERAYITVTDAAGRVLFRRPATQREVEDALRSADEATREGEAAMERIAYDRMFQEIVGETE